MTDIRLATAIMAHPKREHLVAGLLVALGRDVPVLWAEGDSRWETGRLALLEYRAVPGATHVMVLQDDAVIPYDLINGVEKALEYLPGDAIMSLYLGTRVRGGEVVSRMVSRLPAESSWLVSDGLYGGVGIVVPVGLVEDMVRWCDYEQDTLSYDLRISRWVRSRQGEVWYTWPSLVDHRETVSLIRGYSSTGRNAYRFIGADASAMDYDGSKDVIMAHGGNQLWRPH